MKSDMIKSLSLDLTEGEMRLLETALRLDFPSKPIVLKQLSNCTLSKSYNLDSLEIVFEDVREDVLVPSSVREVVAFDSFREKGAYLSAQFLSWKGKIDSFYVYMADGSVLDVENSVLGDVAYSIGDYRIEAEALMRSILRSSICSNELDDILVARLLQKRTKLREYGLFDPIFSFEKTRPVSTGRSEFTPLSFVVDLGDEGSDHYQGIIRFSVFGDFFFAYVIVNGIDIMQPLSDVEDAFMSRFPNGVINYPNGHALEECRSFLYATGYKPLDISFVRSTLSEADQSCIRESSEPLVYDCLFMGKGIASVL